MTEARGSKVPPAGGSRHWASAEAQELSRKETHTGPRVRLSPRGPAGGESARRSTLPPGALPPLLPPKPSLWAAVDGEGNL